MTRKQKESIALDAAYAFQKVSDLNPGGITASWVTYWAKTQEGIFLREAQAVTIAAQASAIIALRRWIHQ